MPPLGELLFCALVRCVEGLLRACSLIFYRVRESPGTLAVTAWTVRPLPRERLLLPPDLLDERELRVREPLAAGSSLFSLLPTLLLITQ